MRIELSKIEIIILILGILLAFFIRILPLFQNNLSFHFDMGRDAFIAEQIWKYHEFKLLGPPTSTQGLFHGVLYYYLIAPFYALGNGNPLVVAWALAFINSTAIVPIYLLAKAFFKSVRWALLTILFFIFSFEAVQYGPWLSNPQPAVVTTAWFFYSLYLWVQRKPGGFILSCLFAALSMQFQFFLLYFVFVIMAVGFLFKLRVSKKELIFGIGVGLLLISTMIIAVFKFGGPIQLLQSLTAFSDTKGSLDANFTDLLLTYINNLSKVFTNNFVPVNVFLGGILAVVAIVWLIVKKELFLLVGIFSSVVMFFFGGHSNVYANIGLVPPALLAVVYLLKTMSQKNNAIVGVFVLMVIVMNLYMIVKAVPRGQYLLVIQPDMILKNQLALIDQSYLLSEGKPFAINSLTVPLWTNTTWAYLYHFYGQEKYGYLPVFYGNDPVGTLGADVVKKGTARTKFFIVEPLKGIPGNITDSEFEKELGNTHILKEYNYGQIRLQQRESNNEATESGQKAT